MVIIRKFTDEDLADLRAMCLRQDDVDELLAADPELSIPDHIEQCVSLSKEAWLVLDGALILAAYGIAAHPGMPDIAIPWLLATDNINLHKKQFVKRAKAVISRWLTEYGELTNLVSLYHVRSIVWLTKCLGFNIPLQKCTYLGNNSPFLYFTKNRGDSHV